MDAAAREEFLFCMKALGFQYTGGFGTGRNTSVSSTGQNEKSYSNDIMSVHKKFVIGRYCRSNAIEQLNTNNDVINENFLRNQERMLYV